jgi:parallel beta-helix repeat protein
MYNIIQESFAAGLGTYSSSNTTVKYNSFVSNSDYGVYIEEGWGNNTIESNVIVGSGYDAIALYGFWNKKSYPLE